MNGIAEHRVRDIESQLARIDRQIVRLQEERERVLRSDEEYAAYLDQYQSCYTDNEPLNVRAYYLMAAELEQIEIKFHEPGADFQALMREHWKRIAELERLEAA